MGTLSRPRLQRRRYHYLRQIGMPTRQARAKLGIRNHVEIP